MVDTFASSFRKHTAGFPYPYLQEMAITPGDSNLFPECDWLLGNHSDELTPWIPVIAARFVVPQMNNGYCLIDIPTR